MFFLLPDGSVRTASDSSSHTEKQYDTVESQAFDIVEIEEFLESEESIESEESFESEESDKSVESVETSSLSFPRSSDCPTVGAGVGSGVLMPPPHAQHAFAMPTSLSSLQSSRSVEFSKYLV